MAQSRYKITKGKQNGYAEYPKTLVEAVYWDKKKKTLEEALEGIETDTDTKLGKKMDKIANPSSGDFVAVDENGNAVSSGKKVSSFIPAPETPGTTGQVIQQNAEGKPEWVTPSAGTTPDSEMSPTSTNAVQNKVITAELEKYAKKDGYYGSLTAGAAENIIGTEVIHRSFLRDTTAGNNDVGSGAAVIKRLGGVSRVWNQILPTASKDFTNDTTDTASALALRLQYYEGSSFLSSVELPSGIGKQGILLTAPDSATTFLVKHNGASSDITVLDINIVSISGGRQYFFGYTVAGNDPTTIGGSIVDNMMLTDLTQLFNGSIPQGYTVADFQRDYPLLYYAYTTGKVLPFAGQNLETTGPQQWDEEWDNGKISPTDGQNMEGTEVRSKDYIRIFPNTVYYMRSKDVAGTFNVFFYDENKVYFDFQTNVQRNGTFTTPNGAAYMRFYEGSSYGTTYNHDICISIYWGDAEKSAQYEPYQKNTLAVNPSAWQDTDGNLVYPYGGMMGKGSVMDYAESEADGYIRKANVVWKKAYLSDIAWNPQENGRFSCAVPDIAPYGAIICPKFVNANSGFDEIVYVTSTSYLNIIDSAFVGYTREQVQTALAGVEFYYQAATPVEKTLKTPVPATYLEDDYGTEAWTPANADEPYTSPCSMNVLYPMNVQEFVRRAPENYISAEDFDTYNQALVTAGVLGSYSREFNRETGKHDFVITAPEPDPEPEE